MLVDQLPPLPIARRPVTGKRVLVALKIVVTTAILVALARSVNLSAVADRLKGIRLDLFAICIIQLLLIPVLGAARWDIVLRCLDYLPRPILLARIFWIGVAFNQILPTTVGGDAVRAWMIYRRGVKLLDSTVSILVERAVSLGALLAMIAVAGALGSDFVPLTLYRLTAALVVAGALLLGILLIADQHLSRLPDGRVLRLCRDVWIACRRIMIGGWAAPLVALAFITNVNYAIAGWWLGLALGLHLGPMVYVVAISVVTLATLVPVSVGGWGVREAATVGLLGPVIGDDVALLFSVVFGAALLLSSLPGLVLLLFTPNNELLREPVPGPASFKA